MSCPSVWMNPRAATWAYPSALETQLVQSFHQRFPGYRATPLTPLNDLAQEMGVKAIFVKDESNRLGLPAFKILGASWGTVRAIAEQTGLKLESDLAEIARTAHRSGTVLFAATEGNHGRAVAKMGHILHVPVRIFMSKHADRETIQKIESEGAHVTVVAGTYDDAVAMAFETSKNTPNGLLIQDNAFAGYEDIPRWIVEGYSTLLTEVEQQLSEQGLQATTIVTPIGVGSLGHAVVAHSKSNNRQIQVVAVEPETAACLHHNLKDGKWSTIDTSRTIMNGMNCGTVSPISWPYLTQGVDISLTISDWDCHQCIEYLQAHQIDAGPCGAGSLAAIKKLVANDPHSFGISPDSVIVLLSTEGRRGYTLSEPKP